MSVVPTNPARTAWRVAGGLALAHIVVMLAAFSQEGVTTGHGDSAALVQHVYGRLSLTRAFTGGYLEATAFLVLVPAMVLLARLVGRRTETGRTAATTFLVLGGAYVAATFAVGFPPGAAAMYAAHHGADPASIAMVNDIRNFGFVLQVLLLAGATLAFGIAAWAERCFTRWAGYGGVAVGAIGVCVVPFAWNAISLVWMIWWVGLAVLCLRGGPRQQEAVEKDATGPVFASR